MLQSIGGRFSCYCAAPNGNKRLHDDDDDIDNGINVNDDDDDDDDVVFKNDSDRF